jgi:hypothetical protein
MYRRADLRPNEGALIYHGVTATGFTDPETADIVGDEAIDTALGARSRVVVVTGSDVQAARLRSRFALHGTVSLEALGRAGKFRWPATMPDYDLDPDGYRGYQEHTLKPFGQAVGRLLATAACLAQRLLPATRPHEIERPRITSREQTTSSSRAFSELSRLRWASTASTALKAALSRFQ